MFQKLDPRVRLLWWLSISIVAMVLRTTEITAVLIFPMYLGWQSAGEVKRLVRFTFGLIPFLLVISVVSLFPTFDIERAMQMSMRYYVLLGMTTLILNTTNYGELTNAFRNLRSQRLKLLEKPLEVFSFIFGLAFLTVPIAAKEWEDLKEVQRMRGSDLAGGNKLIQVRRGLAMLQPLLLRILERIKHFSIAVIMYGYNPFEERTLYNPLKLSRADKRVAAVILAITVTGVVLAFTLKV